MKIDKLTKKQIKICNWFAEHRGYLKKSEIFMFNLYKNRVDNNVEQNNFSKVIKLCRIGYKNDLIEEKVIQYYKNYLDKKYNE